MAKQRFDTKAQAKIKRGNTIVFLVLSAVVLAVFLYMAVSLLSGSVPDDQKYIFELPGVSRLFMMTCLVAAEVFLVFFLPAAGVFFGTQGGRRRGYREAATFDKTLGITYFRDILKDVSPADLSIVMDLQLESGKDISATLLRMYNKNVIEFSDGRIIFKGQDSALSPLSPDELELANMLCAGGITQSGISVWKKNRFKEAADKGYVEPPDKQNKNAGCGGCFGAFIIFAAVMAIFVFLIYKINDMEVMTFIDNLDSGGDYILTAGDISALNEFISYGAIAFGLMDIIFIYPAFALFRYIAYATVKMRNNLKRTPKGNELAEMAAGLKRFIVEFSTLSERKKEEAALWDDFLVYAVVLEENEQIVGDIVKHYHREINLRNFIVRG